MTQEEFEFINKLIQSGSTTDSVIEHVEQLWLFKKGLANRYGIFAPYIGGPNVSCDLCKKTLADRFVYWGKDLQSDFRPVTHPECIYRFVKRNKDFIDAHAIFIR